MLHQFILAAGRLAGRAVVLVALALTALSSTTRPCGAELKPSEIALVAARSSRESQALAQYYCKQRSVPVENICLVDVPRDELLLRETWTWAIRPEIQKWLRENDPDEKLRCFVTVWDVPLRIGPADATPEIKRYQSFLMEERNNRLRLLKQTTESLNALATGDEPERIDLAPGDGLVNIRTDLETALQAAQKALATKTEAERILDGQKLQRLATIAGGDRVLLLGIDQQIDAQGAATPQPMREQFDVLRGRTSAFLETRSLLEQTPPGEQRDALLIATIERTTGLLGTVEWLNEQIEIARKGETGSSFDSELSLVTWADDYQLLRWQPNYLRPAYDNSQLRQINRTFMVARLDGPTIEIAKRLIDDAIAVENAGGLKGKVYIDARGLAKADQPNTIQPGSYEDYDRALVDTAKGIEQTMPLKVVLNESPELFQPGECPDAALYLGWYSLAKYVDAFDFAKGAVAIHYASGEATTLRKQESQVWCKRLLEDGVCATVGPVYEPYLMAFPRPNEFAALLLQGDLTLVEVYYRTKPFNSWMMTLVGDPLYRPFGDR